MNFFGSTSDRDMGAKALLEQIKEADGASLDAGLFEGDNHPESDLSLAQIGAVHEFGSRDGRIPERSWLRRAAHEHGPAWDAAFDRIRDRVLRGEKFFPLFFAFGERVASDIRKTIDAVMYPPKAESTLRAEGGALKRTKTGRVKKGAHEFQRRFTHPLIWLGYMRAAVRSRITTKKHPPRMTSKGIEHRSQGED